MHNHLIVVTTSRGVQYWLNGHRVSTRDGLYWLDQEIGAGHSETCVVYRRAS